MYFCTYVCMYVCVFVCKYACLCVCLRARARAYASACVTLLMCCCACVWVYGCVCVYVWSKGLLMLLFDWSHALLNMSLSTMHVQWEYWMFLLHICCSELILILEHNVINLLLSWTMGLSRSWISVSAYSSKLDATLKYYILVFTCQCQY